MEFENVIQKRRSIREYTEEAIPEEALMRIVEAGLLAPTSRNLKPCTFYVVKDRELLKALAYVKKAGGEMIAQCSVAIIPAADSTKADTWIEDASIALSYMQLAAVNEGVGSCWVQIHLRNAEENVKKLLSLSETDRIVGILSLGMAVHEKPEKTVSEEDRKKIVNI